MFNFLRGIHSFEKEKTNEQKDDRMSRILFYKRLKRGDENWNWKQKKEILKYKKKRIE